MGVFAIESEYAVHTTKDIYRFADQALYEAKENGRNNIVFYDEENVLLKA